MSRLDRRPATRLSRAHRFLFITAITASLGQLTIFVLHVRRDVGALQANVTAALAVALVGYVLSMRYVWPSDPARRYRVEMPVFVLMSLVALVASSLGVALATTVTSHPLAANAASAGSYGVVWVARFLLLDRYVFAPVLLRLEPAEA
ncbi:MAG: GtrA family protein [Acidimicrobiales bacterium]